MKFMFEKNLNIIDELMIYFHKLGATDINVRLHTEGNSTNFVLWGEASKLTPEKLDTLINALNTKRRHEIEEYYWSILGDYETDNQLSLIGMMVDKSEITFENNILTIKLSKIN